MLKYTLTGFADEIDPSLDVQMDVLDELDVHFIEARGVDGKNLCDYTLEEAKVVKERLDARGIKLSAIGSPIGKIMITDDFEPHFEKFCHVCDLAKLFETPYIRMFSFFMPKDEDPAQYRDEVIRRLRCMIEEAAKRGIVLQHENEKGIYGDTADRVLDLMKELYCDNFHCTFDPANFVQCGVHPAQAFEMLKPYVTYMHIKDAKMATGEVVPAGMGDGDVKAVLQGLSDAGFEGYLSLEPHLTNFVGFAALEDDAEEQKKAGASEGARLWAVAAKALRGLLAEIA